MVSVSHFIIRQMIIKDSLDVAMHLLQSFLIYELGVAEAEERSNLPTCSNESKVHAHVFANLEAFL